MSWSVLALDYDGTLASEGRVDRPTLRAVEGLARQGIRLLLVTGREVADLQRVFGRLDLFDRVVAENGGVLLRPAERSERLLAPPASAALVERLRAEGVAPLSVGQVIVATQRPYELVVVNAIASLGLELEIIFNKQAVMVLPSGINKGSGLDAALSELDLPAAGVVGVGDGENDHSLLRHSGLGVAVANAVPALKAQAQWTTRGQAGEGVRELAAWLEAERSGGARGRVPSGP